MQKSSKSEQLQVEEEKVVWQIQSVDEYDQQCLLDKGGQGQVHLMSKDNHLYAVKLPLQNINMSRFQKQHLILQKMDHEHIVKFHEYKKAANVRYVNKMQTQQTAMVLQFAQEGDLFYLCYKKNFSEPVCRVLFQQILSALKYIHEEQKMMHLDMKMENILVDSNFNLKISDFGHAMFYQQIEKGAIFGYGTDLFRPPEYGNISKFNGQKVDVFNTGMILFQLIVGRQPLYSRSQPFRNDKIYRLIKNRKFKSFWKTFQNQLHLNISDNAKRLLIAMMSENPQQRPTINQIFKHQWFVQTRPATHQEVVAQFLPKKKRLLGLKKKKLIQEIKTKFKVIRNIKSKFDNKINNQENNKKPKIEQKQNNQENQNNQANFRQANQFYIRRFHDYATDKTAFSKILTKNKYQVRYFEVQPAFLICMLENVVHNLFQSQQLMIYDEFFKISPLGHNIQIEDLKSGRFVATFEYQMKSLISVDEQQSQTSENNTHKEQQQAQQSLVKVQIQGRMIKKDNKYGIQWINQDQNCSLWKKDLIMELNCICQNLLI